MGERHHLRRHLGIRGLKIATLWIDHVVGGRVAVVAAMVGHAGDGRDEVTRDLGAPVGGPAAMRPASRIVNVIRSADGTRASTSSRCRRLATSTRFDPEIESSVI